MGDSVTPRQSLFTNAFYTSVNALSDPGRLCFFFTAMNCMFDFQYTARLRQYQHPFSFHVLSGLNSRVFSYVSSAHSCYICIMYIILLLYLRKAYHAILASVTSLDNVIRSNVFCLLRLGSAVFSPTPTEPIAFLHVLTLLHSGSL